MRRRSNVAEEQKCSLAERAENQLIDIIKENDLKPGDQLPTESELTERLQIGRSTLREAIKSLVSRNVLETRRGAGTFVSQKQGVPEDPLGLTFVEENEEELALDLNAVRLMIEPEIAGLAALNATEEQKKNIICQCEKVEELIHRKTAYYTEDMEFHKSIAEASGNRVTPQLIPILHYAIGKTIVVTNNQLTGETLVWHRRIAEAIARGDEVGARNAMMVHIELNRREIFEHLYHRREEHRKS